MSEHNNHQEKVYEAERVSGHLSEFSDSDQSLFMGILSYLSVLVIIPLLFSKNNPFVKFHIKQGLVLVVLEAILWVAMNLFWPFAIIVGILQLAVFLLSVLGIVNVIQRKQVELPWVGMLARSIRL